MSDVRGDYLRIWTVLYTRSSFIQWGAWVGTVGHWVVLFHWRRSSFFNKNQRHPSLGQASYDRVAGSWIWSPCLVPCQEASGSWDGCIIARWIWGFRSPKFEFGYYEMRVFRVCGASQNFYVFEPWLRLADMWMFTNINDFRAGSGCAYLVPVYGLLERLGMVKYVLLPRTVMVLRPLILQLYSVMISWWLTQLMHLEERLLQPTRDRCSWSSTGDCSKLGNSAISTAISTAQLLLSTAISMAPAVPNLARRYFWNS